MRSEQNGTVHKGRVVIYCLVHGTNLTNLKSAIHSRQPNLLEWHSVLFSR